MHILRLPRLASACLIFASFVSPIFGQAIWWTGLGDDNNWSTAGNWSGGVVPDSEDLVRLGYAGPEGEVLDAVQAINVDVDSIIDQLRIDGQGQRQVILSSDTDSYLGIFNSGISALTIESTATHDTRFDLTVGLARNATVTQNSSTGELIFSSNLIRTPGTSTFAVRVSYRLNGNVMRLEGGYNDGVTFMRDGSVGTGGTIIVDGGESTPTLTSWVAETAPGDAVPTLRLNSDLNVTGVLFANTDVAYIERSGEGDRAIVSSSSRMRVGGTGGEFRVLEGQPGHGHLTIHAHGWIAGGGYINTAADSTVRISNNGVGSWQLMAWADNPGISGAGDMHLAMTTNGSVFPIIGRQMDYTGRTILERGVLRLASHTEEVTEDVFVTYFGNLPQATIAEIGAAATLDLNGIDQTLGGLADYEGPGGAVQMNSEAVLTINTAGAGTDYSGTLSGTGSLVVDGSGEQVLSGVHTFEGSTTLSGGTLVLDYATENNSKLSETAELVFDGGSLVLRDGSHTETVANTVVSGGSTLEREGGTAILSMGEITRVGQGTIDFAEDNIAETVTANTNGILGSWATVGGETWAVSGGDGVDPGFITGLASSAYDDDYATAGATSHFDASASGSFSGQSVASLRFNSNESVTAGVTGTFTLEEGAILVTPNVGAHDSVISGGTSLTSGNGEDIIISQYNAAGDLIIETEITGAIGLTHAGDATTVLVANNSYTGETLISGGMLQLGDGSAGRDGTIDDSSGIVNNSVLSFNRSGSNDHSGEISGSGIVVMQGTGTQVLSGNNTYSGGTDLLGGTLVAGSNQALGDESGGVFISGSEFAVLRFEAGVEIANDISFMNIHSASIVENVLGEGDPFSTGTSGEFASSFESGTVTSATFLGGASADGTTLEMRFSTTSANGVASNDDDRRSDVFSLIGTGSDIFALQLAVASVDELSFLGWYENGVWVNAVDGNSALGAEAVQGFLGSFVDSGVLVDEDYLGSWGVDIDGGSVWAILDHNSEFAVIPEPRAVALLFGLITVALVLRRSLRPSR